MRYVCAMLFRRRKQSTWQDRVREFFWPRKGLGRPLRYLGMRIVRLSASPHAVALGVASGTFAAFTPFLGLHVVLALALAYLLSGNLVAAALATAVANPLTLPLIWTATLRAGELVLGTTSQHSGTAIDLARLFDHLTFSDLWRPVLKPMLVGSVAIGAPAAALAYGASHAGVRAHRRRRLQRLAHRGTQQLA